VNSQVWWFVARSSGIIAWALLTLSVVWGLLLSTKVSATRIAARKLRPAWILDLHRHLGGLAVIFTAIHLIGIAGDSYVTFGWADIFLPMASEWKPGAVAFGVVSLYLLLAIEVTSLAIRRLPRTAWRWVHRTSFVLYATATYHGILAGTDAGNQWFRAASWISIVVVVVLTVRLLVVLRRKSVSDRRRPVAAESPDVALDVVPDVVLLPVPVPAPAAMATPSPTSVTPLPSPMPAAAAPVMPLVAAIPPLPGTVTELAAPVGAVAVTPLPPITGPPVMPPPPAMPLPTLATPPPPPPPPPPSRPPHRVLAEVNSGGRGGDDLAPPPGTT
jgi:DMSO/TMAO reductase YedYZ heme-binding membrane subunit